MHASMISCRDGRARLDGGPRQWVDLTTGVVEIDRRELVRIGRPEVVVARRYRSSGAAEASLLGAGWSLALEGGPTLERGLALESGLALENGLALERGLALESGDVRRTVSPSVVCYRGAGGVEVELCSRGGDLTTLEVRRARSRCAVRWLELSDGKLVRVRDERERILEEYEYDGALLVGARSAVEPWRYFEYDGRGHRARCVRTWSATGLRDRQISYPPRATVIDDACGETWVVQRGGGAPALVDPVVPEQGALAGGDAPAEREEVTAVRVESAASGDLARLTFVAAGRPYQIRVDASGAIVELRCDDGEVVRWTRDERGTEVVRTSRGASRACLVLDARGAPVRLVREGPRGRESAAATYDADGALSGWEGLGGAAKIESDAEGRPLVVQGPRGTVRMRRDRAGRVVRLEHDGDRLWCEAAARLALSWSVEGLARALDADLSSRPVALRFEPELEAATEEHVRACLGQASCVGLEPRS